MVPTDENNIQPTKQPPEYETPSALLLRLFTERYERQLMLNTEWLPLHIRDRTVWSNIAEYLVDRSGIIDIPPSIDAFPDEEVIKVLEEKYRHTIRELVRIWHEKGIL